MLCESLRIAVHLTKKLLRKSKKQKKKKNRHNDLYHVNTVHISNTKCRSQPKVTETITVTCVKHIVVEWRLCLHFFRELCCPQHLKEKLVWIFCLYFFFFIFRLNNRTHGCEFVIFSAYCIFLKIFLYR